MPSYLRQVWLQPPATAVTKRKGVAQDTLTRQSLWSCQKAEKIVFSEAWLCLG